MITECEKILIRILKAIGLSEDDTVGVMASLETPEQQDMLVDFLEANRNATNQDVLRETVRILKLEDLTNCGTEAINE